MNADALHLAKGSFLCKNPQSTIPKPQSKAPRSSFINRQSSTINHYTRIVGWVLDPRGRSRITTETQRTPRPETVGANHHSPFLLARRRRDAEKTHELSQRRQGRKDVGWVLNPRVTALQAAVAVVYSKCVEYFPLDTRYRQSQSEKCRSDPLFGPC